MSFMDAINKITTKFKKPEPQSEQKTKYQNVLRQLIDHAEHVYSTAVKSALPVLYIYPVPDANIDLIKDMYADMGIILNKHISHLDGKETEVLYITAKDIFSLPSELQEFLESTAPTHKRQFGANDIIAKMNNVRKM
jgi:hypothetical protein